MNEMTTEEKIAYRRSLHPEMGGLIQQNSPISGIGFYPVSMSKGGHVVDVRAVQQ